MKSTFQYHSNRQSGFSIVELMVGIMVGLLVVLAATAGTTFYEANRRTSMGSNSALENATAVAYAIQAHARMAGFGSSMTLSNGTTTCPSIANPVTLSTDANTNIAISYYPNLNPAASSCGTQTTYSYRLNSNKIQMSTDGFTNVIEDVAENIVQIKAQYGITNTSGSTVIDKWLNPANLTGTVLAIRYVIVARSPQKEKLTDGKTVCDASSSSNQPTTAAPLSGFNTLNGTDDTAALDLTGNSEWKCYSYRTVTMTVPLKNVLIQNNNNNAS